MQEHRELWWSSPTVELGKVVQLDLPEPFRAAHGGALPAIQVSYESWGELNSARDNVVLVIHPMTADCHATGEFAGQETGWWEALIGPGRALDTDTHFVVCPNLIGGCYGATGPRFPAPDQAPYLERFPLVTPRDLMRAQRLFLAALGIERVKMVIGPSMGGMIAWEWAVEASEAVDQVVVVAAPLRTSAQQIGLNWLQRRGIELDLDGDEVVAKLGQMVARGVGMMSYRSPVGLEEKFGREWFKRPGSTLGERGMFNVESWLRHHGKRITRRFDPYTYLLFSRAMDLHDVSEGRGDLVTTLNRVTCPVLVVGISSDYLYPPDEVHLGADVLHHLGRDVRYREIRSPNGHDAFLLDTDQLGDILRDLASPRRRRIPTREDRALPTVRVGILGAGRVAASFVKLMGERRKQLRQRGLVFEIQGVAEIDSGKRLDPAFEGIEIDHRPDRFVHRPDLDVVVDLTRGDGARPLVEAALKLRRHVVTPNKVMLRAHGDALDRLAFQNGVRLAYHDSVAAGWPLIHALERPLSRGEVTGIQAVLSGAMNVVVGRMEEGISFKAALAEAVRLDLTEPDPELDVSGWDTAQKLTLLLTRATGRRLVGQEIETVGVDGVDPVLVRKAPERGQRIKLVGLVRRTGAGLAATVRPMAVPADSHLGLIQEGNNVVVIQTAEGGEMVYMGSGGGALPVATAVLNDLIGVCDPSQSWTGRFPAADLAVSPPRFARWLAVRDGVATEVLGAVPDGVPMLDVRAEASSEDL